MNGRTGAVTGSRSFYENFYVPDGGNMLFYIKRQMIIRPAGKRGKETI
ncbi:hypothetical protein CLOSTASPAR_04627 [[Clostridium] asparagiforme DSM 15981]|uniref:Uncharacterized protein n=1 Tax=[Clostridium] asparagiforme DSM 15981 TaxID=518636 RepID=C0D5T1_9FIRM|nr:hypothetical protein CLOSTASPAR_04627 [[Clostridium] asparagiforme DSM 15981]